MAGLRLFTAVHPTEQAHEAIVAAARALGRRLGTRSVRWVAESNLHVTLQFLGDSREESVEPIADAMRRAAARTSVPVEIASGAIGAFPDAKRPRTVWVGIDDPDGALAGLEQTLRRELAGIGLELEQRAFRPHVTIGYVRKNVGSRERSEISQAVRGAGEGTVARVAWAVTSIALVKSVLGPGGSRYTTLRSIDLGT